MQTFDGCRTMKYIGRNKEVDNDNNNKCKFLEDYVKVDDLIKEMNRKYPEGRLVTEMIEKTSEMVVF